MTWLVSMHVVRGGRFSFIWKIDMKGPYLPNIGQNNHVLERKRKN